ncbi:lipocalin family protein [Solimonas marina]|uniref:Outer membrane lipoprotein Blc n=1 Tax=Solimonas marina TaxID=2714601 RepID=A0A969WCI3_9GAMM|nr:lipocalin family protein [Solimonas marina]NKF23689.1 lipocalin family protein [Solimonas marina]
MTTRRAAAITVLLSTLAACATTAQPPIETVPKVELSRYVGDWYVIANIPPGIEKPACNSIEHYELADDGSIATTFTYHKKRPDGPLKTLHSTAYVDDHDSNARWGVQFIWPFRAQYLIAWLADDYSQVIVARDKRDYVWYMARTPSVSDADMKAAEARIAAMGYDITQLHHVPQVWPAP